MILEWWTRNREMGMKMGRIWRIQADMGNPGYDLPDSVG